MKNRLIEPPVCRPNFKILLLKFWKVCSECPYSKIEKHITNLNDRYLYREMPTMNLEKKRYT